MTGTGKYGVLCLAILATLLEGTAAECPALRDCESCPDGVHCERCRAPDLFILNEAKTGCESCYDISGGTCERCTSRSQCDKCMTGGPVLAPIRPMCESCADNCEYFACKINGAGKCDKGMCVEGFTLNADKTCSSCADGCYVCEQSGPGKCDTCPQGMVLNSETGDCAVKADTSAGCSLTNCASCPDKVHCEKCKFPGYEILNEAGTGCEECFDISEGSCTMCTSRSHCDECAGAVTGFVAPTDKAMCAVCGQNCENGCTQNGAGKCDERGCADGFRLDANNDCVA